MHASTDANVKIVIHVLINNIPIEHIQPNTAAVEYAVRLAHRDIRVCPSNGVSGGFQFSGSLPSASGHRR
jgi:hypothetical protein